MFPEPLLTEEQAWAVEAYTAIASWRPGLIDMATGEWSGPPGYEGLAALADEKLTALRQTARRGSSPVAFLEEYGRSVAARFPPQYAKAPHWVLARLLAKVGRPFEDLLRAGHRAELEALQDNGHGLTWEVEILTGARQGSCRGCAANAGRRLPLADALPAELLPCSGCTCEWHDGVRGFCACCYLFNSS